MLRRYDDHAWREEEIPKEIALEDDIALYHSASPIEFLPAIDAGPLLTSLGNRKVPVYSPGQGSYPWP